MGAATALLLLSELPPAEMIEALLAEDALRFQAVKGVGTKTARRIVLELKGKVEETAFAAGVRGDEERPAQQGSELAADLVAGLTALGFARSTASEAASRVLAEHPAEENLAALIKAALARLTA